MYKYINNFFIVIIAHVADQSGIMPKWDAEVENRINFASKLDSFVNKLPVVSQTRESVKNWLLG
jgi:hypothetical protein